MFIVYTHNTIFLMLFVMGREGISIPPSRSKLVRRSSEAVVDVFESSQNRQTIHNAHHLLLQRMAAVGHGCFVIIVDRCVVKPH